ncbi:ABC transporter permease [Chelatococcus asaccharovorans]|uniref:ABC transporter permease n=1 Tax=Chelatococcus asaccharovorans TaxID=28210 RepID=UPI00224C73E7|nr:ABC transporter permease [Chelatococcus asaccharovorans]CAH1659814.1 ABC transporter family protein YhhJ [Chelatococcus asaccharovorans]CAH1684051.1 ABC transporter family protein YhhJ [Chelatococcus asaccharovorans]
MVLNVLARMARIFRLGVKELRSLKADPVLVALIVYTFTVAVYTVANGAKFEVENAAVAVVDEDRSMLSARLRDALMKPFFKEPVLIDADEIEPAMDQGRVVFVVEIPPKFEQDVLAGRHPTIALDIDATAMSQAGNGASYIQNIILAEVSAALPGATQSTPIDVTVRVNFNPNLKSGWFTAVMQVINNITMLAVILAGAALIREREHGTIEHLLVMPVTPIEIMLAKVWANGLVIVVASTFSLLVVVEWLLAVPIAGSVPLFVGATVLYLFSVTALGILIATISTSMGQFGLIVMPSLIIMNLLSGSTTPMESMPVWLQNVMQLSPSTHFVALSQAVLYRGAGADLIWPQMLALVAIGGVFFAAAALRFRKALLSSS